MQTTVPTIDFDWGTGSPDATIRPDNHSTLFVGKLIAPATGTYEILGYGDDDTHVFVDGQLVSSDPLGHGHEDPPRANSVSHGGGAATIALTAGQSYDLVALQAEGAAARASACSWVPPSMRRQLPTRSSSPPPTWSPTSPPDRPHRALA